MTLSSKTLLALGLGIVIGLFFGEMVGFLQIPADIFVLLLQMTVLPYVTLSLIAGFGQLSYTDAKMLAVKGGSVLLLLWAIAFSVLLLIPLAYPDWQSASFFSTTLLETRKDVDYFEIFIPSNPFHSMAQNLVPAVVIFSICVGVALIGIDDKQHLIKSLAILKTALTRITDFMVSMMPLGIFLISASAAGTMRLAELERLQIHLLLYFLITLLFTLWILPGLVATLTSIKYRDILRFSKAALLTAFMTATLLVVLPLLVENCKVLLSRQRLKTKHSEAILDAAIPTSFNFPQTGKILTMSFILFAAWFSGHPLPYSDYPLFMISGLASFFGSLNVAVPFLLDLFHIPADLFQLFLVSGVLNSRFGSLLAAMHTLVFGLLVTCAVTGKLHFEAEKIFRFTLITIVLTISTIGSAKLFFSYVLSNQYEQDEILHNMKLMHTSVPTKVYKTAPKNPLQDDAPELSKRAAIRQRGYLRVGYLAENLPYAFFNKHNQLVGFDIEMAHILAEELGVKLELVPVNKNQIAEHLDTDYCDIIMSGIVVTIHRAEKMTFSDAYMTETAAFIVKDYRRKDFVSAAARANIGPIKIADTSHNNPDYIRYVQRYFPDAEFVSINTMEDFFNDSQDRFDAILSTAERGSAWSLVYADYTVTIPQPHLHHVPLAYPVSLQHPDFAKFISTWVQLKKMDGTLTRLHDYWILGNNAVPTQARWSIIRNVLHWVN